MSLDQYRALPLKPLNTIAVIELQVFFDQLFTELTKYAPTTSDEILDKDANIVVWKEKVSQAKFDANYVYTSAIEFYKANYKDYEDIHRSTFHRLLRSAMNTLNFLGNSPAKMLTSVLSTGGLATMAIYYASSQTKIHQVAFEEEKKIIQRDIKSGNKMIESTERQIEIANADINQKKDYFNKINTTLTQTLNEKQKLEAQNEFHEYDEKIGKLEALIMKQEAINQTAFTAFITAASKLEDVIQKQGSIEIGVTNKLPGATEMAQYATESLTNSSFTETFTNLLPIIAFGGFTIASILGLSAICSRRNRNEQLKRLKLNISSYVNTFHINMITSDYNRKLIDDKFNLDQKSFQNLLDFQHTIQESLRKTEKLQTHHLMDQCRTYRNKYHKVDFLYFYYYLRRFMTSTFNWTETECDTTHSLFFEEVFDELNAKRASKKYNESNGVYDGEFDCFIPTINNMEPIKEPIMPLVLHLNPKSNVYEKEEKSRFTSIEDLEEQAKLAKKNENDIEFWTIYIKNKDPIVFQYLGNKIWGEDKWIYLQHSQSMNEKKNSFDNEDIYQLMLRLKENEEHHLMAKHIWEGFSVSISELLLPFHYHKLRTDSSYFYKQCRIDKELKYIVTKYIDLIMLYYIEFFNIEYNEFFNKDIYAMKFEELMNQFLRECGMKAPTIIVFALRALAPTVIENSIIEAILYKRDNTIQEQFIQFGQVILDLYEGKPSLGSDGSNDFTPELPSADFPIVSSKRKQLEEQYFDKTEEQPSKKYKDIHPRRRRASNEDVEELKNQQKRSKTRPIVTETFLEKPRREKKEKFERLSYK